MSTIECACIFIYATSPPPPPPEIITAESLSVQQHGTVYLSDSGIFRYVLH